MPCSESASPSQLMLLAKSDIRRCHERDEQNQEQEILAPCGSCNRLLGSLVFSAPAWESLMLSLPSSPSNCVCVCCCVRARAVPQVTRVCVKEEDSTCPLRAKFPSPSSRRPAGPPQRRSTTRIDSVTPTNHETTTTATRRRISLTTTVASSTTPSG